MTLVAMPQDESALRQGFPQALRIAPSETSLKEVYDLLYSRYDVVNEDVLAGGSHFSILKVRDTNSLLDRIDPIQFAKDERLPYWADLWPASLALAAYCLQTVALRGKSVLELGSGLGLAGIAAARAAAHVTMTDYDDDALRFSLHNAVRNLSADEFSRVTVRFLDWRSAEDIGTFDVVLGSDVVYDRGDFQPMLTLLRRVLRRSGCAVFADPDRSIGADFARMAADSGFEVQSRKHNVTVGIRDALIRCYELRLPAEVNPQ